MQKRSKKRSSEVKDAEKESDTKKAKVFCGREFRKELKKENLIPCLKNFLQLAEEYDAGQIVFEYLEAGGSVQEILLLLDQTAKADLVSALPVFKVLHLIFISIKDSDSKYYAEAKDGAKFMLDSFISTIEAMMNINSNKHRKVILKVLTSVVTLFPTYGREIMTLIPNSPSVLSQFLRPQPGKDSLRSWSIFFILSFLVGGDFTLIQTVLNMKGLLADIINDLEFDEAHTVNVFLSVVQEKVLENFKVTKTLKLKVFNTQVITSLFKVYNWKGPKNITVGSPSSKKGSKEKEVNQEEKELVTESIHNFLTVLCTSKKFGIIFTDNSFGTYGESKNNLLCTVFQSIPEPWENNKMSEIVIRIVVTCPELMNVILHRIESGIQPRNSKKWNNLIQFVERLLEEISPKDILTIASAVSEIDLVQLSKQFCTPAVLIHNLSLGLRNRACLPVLYYSMRVLSLLWKKTAEVLESFGTHEKLKKTLTSSFSSCFIELNDILDIWKTICSSSTSFDYTDKKNFLNVILNFLEMNSKCDRNLNDSPSRIALEMIESLDPIRESLGDDFDGIQSKIFHLITWVDPMSITPDSDLFRKAMLLLFNNKNKSTIESLTKIILSTGVFENCESEIDIWLACYFDRFDEYHNFIPSIFTDSMSQLYLKEFNFAQNFGKNFSKRKSVFTELMDIDSSDLLNKKWVGTLMETPTPMLMQSLEILKNLKPSGNKREKKQLQNYIKQVAFRLFHYYNNNEALMKFCLQYKNELGDSIFDYITGKGIEIFTDDPSFLTNEEKELMAWILKQSKNFNFENSIKKEDGHSLRLFLTFNTVVSYLLYRINEDCLSKEDVTKLSLCFTFFLNLGSKEETTPSSYSKVLSYDLDNLNFLRAKCIQRIFSVPLVNKFDVFEHENRTIMNFTKLMASVIMEMNKDEIKFFSSVLPWKEAFLKKITSNLRDNNKTWEMFRNVEPLLDCFHYSSCEISTTLNEYCNITDMKSFVTEKKLTVSAMILTKFIKLHCDHSEVEPKFLRQLWNIVQYMTEEKSEDFEIIDNCFIEILKKRPKSMSLIDNDFVEWFLKRSHFTEETVLLGSLLLSDPGKVKYFITYAKDNFKELKNKKILVALLSKLVHKEDEFLDLLRFHKFCCHWKESELVSEEERNSEFLKLLKLIYKKYKGCIFNCDYKDIDFLLKYSEFFSMLTKCFLEKDLVLELKDIVGSGKFSPEIIHRVVLKNYELGDLVEAYVQGLLILFYDKAKEVENTKCNELVWVKYSTYICDFSSVKGNFNWSKIRESAMWKDFVRLCLRICFKFPDCPSFLKTVRCFFELFYKPGENTRDVAIIFEMLISHSQFLSSMLQNSLLKEELVSFYYSIIRRNTEVLSVKHIPIILASYSASLSKNDVTLLNVLRFYEENNIAMNEYEPLVWGELAVTHYSIKSNVGVSLWRRVSMLNVLELLDFRKIEVSLKEFPIYRNFKEDGDIFNDKIYDPAFLLHIFANLLSPGAITFCLPFVQKGCFAFTVCALSSLSKEIRITASVVLARFYNHLELVQNMKLKSVWLHFINCLRYAVEDINRKPLPSIVTYFLAKTSLEISGEPGEMFISLQKFLLAKPVFNFEHIPEFLPFFHSSDTQYTKQRRWLLEVLRDGFKRNVDLDLLFQTMAVKLILSFFRSQFCSREIKILILEVFTVILKADKSKLLISEYGFLTWLNAVCLSCDQELFTPFVKLVSSAMGVTKEKLVDNAPEERNLIYPIQILNILMKTLPNLKHCRLTDTHEIFLNVVLNCLMMLLQFDHKDWCKSNRDSLVELSKITVKVLGDESLHEKLEKSKVFFGFDNVPSNLERLHRKIMFLGDVLTDFR